MSDNVDNVDFLANIGVEYNTYDMGFWDLLDSIGPGFDVADVGWSAPADAAASYVTCPPASNLSTVPSQQQPMHMLTGDPFIEQNGVTELIQTQPQGLQLLESVVMDSSAQDLEPGEDADGTLRCRQCGKSFERWGGKRNEYFLEYHSKKNNHTNFPCDIVSCGKLFITVAERDAHQRRPHHPNHGQLEQPHPFACVECDKQFKTRSQLQLHGNESQHSPFACICGKRFARLDVLHRHLDSLGTAPPKHPCPWCKNHRGKNGFRRRDHLLQHIRGYHKFDAEEKIADLLPSRPGKHRLPPVCPHQGCSEHRDKSFKSLHPEEQDKSKPFAKQSDYTIHMKEVHNHTPFPCNAMGCDRTGAKGYVREKDLMKHRNDKHPEEAVHVPQTRDMTIECRYPECNREIPASRIGEHVVETHVIREELLAFFRKKFETEWQVSQ